VILLAAVLVFVGIVATIAGAWLVIDARRDLRARLGEVAGIAEGFDQPLLRDRARRSLVHRLVGRLTFIVRLDALREQAGLSARFDPVLVVAVCGVAGAVPAMLRTGSLLWAIVWAAAAGAAPIAYLFYQRQQRMRRFEQLFPDSLDVMTRSLRAGHALGAAIQHVGENMPDPVGPEFQRVAEEIRLGLEPGEALSNLQTRVPTPDVRFFCTAIRIQRSAGGNLAEVLERLSDVVRDRFRLLSQARALSAQHRWSAICVGLSPLAFAAVFGLLQPGYFNPLLESEHRNLLIGTGLALEAVGFLSVWKIARIEV
jgi:tight adherence protein B